MKRFSTSGLTAAGVLVLALGAGAVGGVVGGGSDPASPAPATVGVGPVSDDTTLPSSEPSAGTVAAAPTMDPDPAAVSAPVPSDNGSAPVPSDTETAQQAADRAEKAAKRAEDAADRAATPTPAPVASPVAAPQPAPTVAPDPTPVPTPNCAPEGNVAHETQYRNGGPWRTRTVTCTDGKSVYGPWEYLPAPTPTPLVP